MKFYFLIFSMLLTASLKLYAQDSNECDPTAVVMRLGVYPTEQTPDIDAKIQLGMVKNLKEVSSACNVKEIQKAYQSMYGQSISPALTALFDKKNLDKYTSKMVDNLIAQINDPEKTPYGDLDGSLGETKARLFSTVKLDGSQRDRFYNAVSNAVKRNAQYFSAINDNCEKRICARSCRLLKTKKILRFVTLLVWRPN